MLTEPLPDTTLLGIFAFGGVLFHHAYARRVEIDFNVWRLLGFAGLQSLVLIWWFLSIWQTSSSSAIYRLCICLLSFASSLLSSILVYRALLHRLQVFPGPLVARLSSLWTVRQSSGDFKFHQRLTELHRQHGDFVRIGPRILSVTRADALPQLMALNKGVFWSHTGDDYTKLSFSLSRVVEDHKLRRRPWEQAFSTQSLDKFDSDIQGVIGAFLQQAREHGIIDVPAVMGRLSFDVMGLVGFGRSFHTTAQGIAHPGLLAMRKAHFVLGSLRWMPWLMHMLSSLPGGSDFAPFLAMCANVVRERQTQYQAAKHSVKDSSGSRKDVMAYLLETMEDGGPAAPQTQEAMNAESRVMIAAGADTTQSALANTLWYLTATPTVLRKLQKLLDTTFPDGPDSFSYAKLIAEGEVLEWTDAIIQEAMRLRPAGVCGNPRTTDPKGLIIPKSEIGPEVWIPGEIDVLVPTWLIQRDERWFERPNEFIPDRWLPGSEVFCDRAAYFPFNIGKHACVGKPLAMRELRSVIARVALSFNLVFPEDEDWDSYEQGIMDTFTMTLPPFRLVFHDRHT